MRHKKFKTVAGYLRSMEEGLHVARVEPGSDAERAHERRIINSLLPQIGIDGMIADSEAPCDGIDRMRQLTTNPTHSKALDTCRKWLGRMKLVDMHVTEIRTVKGLGG